MLFFCLLFMTKVLALLLFFLSYLIESGLILHRYFSLDTLHFLIAFINSAKSFLAAAEGIHILAVSFFSVAAALFSPSVSTLFGSSSTLSVCSVTSLRCSRLRLQQSRCRWCKVMQNLQDGSSALFTEASLSNASIRFSHYHCVHESIHMRLPYCELYNSKVNVFMHVCVNFSDSRVQNVAADVFFGPTFLYVCKRPLCCFHLVSYLSAEQAQQRGKTASTKGREHTFRFNQP